MTDPKNPTNTDTTAERPPVDDSASTTGALREKLIDAQTPGYQAEFDPEKAERAGAFVKDALNEQDAIKSSVGLASLGADQPPLDIIIARLSRLTHIRTASARSIFGCKPGETVDEAIARKKAEED